MFHTTAKKKKTYNLKGLVVSGGEGSAEAVGCVAGEALLIVVEGKGDNGGG